MVDGTIFQVATEDDAWRLFKDALDRKIDTGEKPEVQWQGWPSLRIDLPATPIPGSISPSMMGAFLELQNSIYRTHTILSSGTESLRGLNRLEKEQLEFRVRVEKGSSLYSVDLQQILQKLGFDIVAKMTGTELVITVLGLAIIFAGTVVWTRLLDQRTDQRRIESDDADTRSILDSFKSQLGHDTQRYDMLTRALTGAGALKRINAATEPARDAVIEAIAEESGGDIQGIHLSPEIAREVSIKPRQSSTEIQLSRIYGVSKVDTTVPDGFRVTLHDVKSGLEISASLLDALVSGHHRALLRDAEWKKHPIKVSLTGRKLRGEIVDAQITSVEEA